MAVTCMGICDKSRVEEFLYFRIKICYYYCYNTSSLSSKTVSNKTK